ncbi:galactokinase [Batrachochytrium salamandrivorans]|nr:galactokinase [Batrachochytrium salamandrivorans]
MSAVLFANAFGGEPEVVARAPGRVNLLGEHTDYELGYCLPIAIPQYTFCCLRRSPTSTNQLVSSSFPEAPLVEFGLWGSPKEGWGKHIAAIAIEYRVEFCFQASFTTELALGSGLSSSAALEVAFATALEQLIDSARDWDPTHRALLCVRACNGPIVDIPCGILDQMSSALGQAGCAMFLDCALKQVEQIPWPSSTGAKAVVLVTNTMVKHSHATGEYRTRVTECKQACRELGVVSLREVIGKPIPELSTKQITARARHVVGENLRCLQAKQCLQRHAGDWTIEFGALMNQSHTSLANDYEVSCPELDFVVEEAQRFPGVYGSRMTGGGFGGCTVTLCQDSQTANALAEHLSQVYFRRFQLNCEHFKIPGPASGAQVLV